MAPKTWPDPQEHEQEHDRAPASSPHSRELLHACKNLYKAVCKRKGVYRDPTGYVKSDTDGERDALQLEERIFSEHENWTQEEIHEEIARTIYTPLRRNRLTTTHRWVLLTLEAFIDKQPESVFSRSEKRALKRRLRAVKLILPPPASNYTDNPDLFTKSEIFYERMEDGRTRLRVGGAYLLSTTSWFNMVFTFAHELAHAIDPCELRTAAPRISIPAYDRLTGCLLRQGLIAVRKTRSECGDNDQLSEIFSDWLAAQVSVEALRNYGTEFHGQPMFHAAVNSILDLCDEDEGDQPDQEFHASPRVRIEKIFGAHPEVQDLMGCPKRKRATEYCDFGSP